MLNLVVGFFFQDIFPFKAFGILPAVVGLSSSGVNRRILLQEVVAVVGFS